ncbi:T9SS type A sorting domain-containing protein [Flavivirga jejuensis]|uniref:T9SS type A sorting domain-containing protein n=1 Tax=Flavivirga jejuensis TaxID=870487 RepID=A0ABT8WKX5_9FLAO|nr:T9SS type A sorting domain-containing protein [Flavivirga jejuensis]MDO5973804.1 T9SS type A sorting domain-containing protein [Flavivirga jejuensis]
MKNQLLFTFAFLAAIFIASAQSNTLTFTGTATDSETFSFGNTAMVYALSGSDFSQGGQFFGYGEEVTNPSTISESFKIKTDANNVNATLTFRYRKGAASIGSGVISVAGQADFAFTFNDDSGTDGDVANVDKYFDYTTVIPLSTTETDVTITVNEFLTNGASVTRLRFYSVEVKGDSFLSTNDIDTQVATISAYPNPVTNSFQLNSNKNIENVKLYNITGRLLKTFNTEENYDISDLATGVYLAQVKTQSSSKTLRIVKK